MSVGRKAKNSSSMARESSFSRPSNTIHVRLDSSMTLMIPVLLAVIGCTVPGGNADGPPMSIDDLSSPANSDSMVPQSDLLAALPPSLLEFRDG